jgi:hypothetical protein
MLEVRTHNYKLVLRPVSSTVAPRSVSVLVDITQYSVMSQFG